MLAYNVFLMIGLKQGCTYTYLMFLILHWLVLPSMLSEERRKEAERIALRTEEELRRQQQQLLL